MKSCFGYIFLFGFLIILLGIGARQQVSPGAPAGEGGAVAGVLVLIAVGFCIYESVKKGWLLTT